MSKTAQSNWDDLKFVLAVADHGSVAAAARALDVNHATVLRRIGSFETRHGLRMFDKTGNGYQLSADRRALVDAIREAGAALETIDRMIDAVRPKLGTGLRITSTDTLCQLAMPPVVSRLAAETGLSIDLVASNAHFDLSRQEADLTVRPSLRLPDDLSGEIATHLEFAVFCSRHGDDGWLGTSGPLQRSAAGQWLERNVGRDEIAITADSFTSMAALAASGGKRAILPVIAGRAQPGLARLEVACDVAPVPIWVACHIDLAKSGRLSRARTFIAAALAEEMDRLQS